MDKYIKIPLTWKEKIIFLITNLMPEEKIPVRVQTVMTDPEIPTEEKPRVFGDPSGTFADTKGTYAEIEKENIPFFEINQDKVESNL